MRRRTFISAAIGAFAALSGPSPAQGAERRMQRGTAPAFGATVAVSVLHDDAARAQVAVAAALQAMLAVDRLTALGDAASAVARLNRDGVLAQPSPALLALLSQACALSALTDGAFDVTVQPLLQVYGDTQRWGALPERHEIDAARALIGWRRLAFGREQVRFMRPGMALTVDGLAQGYAADVALAVLRRHGVHDALVDTGAIAVSGAGVAPWRADAAGAAPLRDRCMATSTGAGYAGDADNAGDAGHGGGALVRPLASPRIIDPATGHRPDELARVTVLAPLGLLADGLATAFMVMGAKKAHALAARLPGIDVLTVDRQGAVRRSAGFAAAYG